MAAIITTAERIYAANLFVNGFDNDEENVYLFIGKTLPWSDENSPPTPVDCVQDQVQAFQNMMSLKLIGLSSVSLVIPRNDWTTGIVYSQYSDAVDLFDPNSSPPPFFVISDQLNVYMCLNNNKGALSTIQPTGTATTPITVADGYQWKYMYTVSSADVLNFVTNNWVPVDTLITNDGSNQWLVQQAAVPGTVDRVDMVTEGTQYTSIPSVAIVGNGTGATAVATISGGNVTGITVTAVGSGYTYATVSITGGGVGANGAAANAVLSPFAGHGADPTTELGGFNVLVDCKLNGTENGYFTVDNDYRQIGIIQNPILNDGLNTPATAPDLIQAVVLTFLSVSGTTFNTDETVTGNTSGATGVVMDWDGTAVLRLVQSTGTFIAGETVIGVDASGVLSTITGTAQAGSTSLTIILANSASSVNSTYNGQTILLTGGTGAGQTRIISGYVGLTRTATISPAWLTTPTNTSTYVVASIIAPQILPYKGSIVYLENRRCIMRAPDQVENVKIVIDF